MKHVFVSSKVHIFCDS